MIFIVYTGTVSFITRTELTLAEWDKRFDKFLRVVGFISDEEFLDELRFLYRVDDKTVEEINEIISKKSFVSIRITNKAFEGFIFFVEGNQRSVGKVISLRTIKCKN